MTIQHISMVFAAGGLDGPEKLLMMAYANRADDHGYCWPGVQRLADDCGTSVATVKRVKAKLIAKNLIKVENRSKNKGEKPLTDLTRINITKLASMKRAPRKYDDNMVERITFDVDLPVDNSESTPVENQGGRAQDEPTPGLKMSPPRAQDEPLTPTEPSTETPEGCGVARSTTSGSRGSGSATADAVEHTQSSATVAKLVLEASAPVADVLDRMTPQEQTHALRVIRLYAVVDPGHTARGLRESRKAMAEFEDFAAEAPFRWLMSLLPQDVTACRFCGGSAKGNPKSTTAVCMACSASDAQGAA